MRRLHLIRAGLRRRPRLAIIGAVGLLAGAAAWAPGPAARRAAHLPAVPAAAATHTVIAESTGFVPATIVMAAGDSLDLDNVDPLLAHSLTSDGTDAAGAPLFTSGPVAAGATAPVNFPATLPPGVYQFHCDFHFWMHGVLEVTAPLAGQTGSAATATSASSGSSGAEWPLYGADLANTRTVVGGPAASAVTTMSQAWRDDFTDGDFTGTPVVSGGVVYVGSNGGRVRAIQAVSTALHQAGQVLWTASAPTSSNGAPDPVNGSLAVSGSVVYVPVARLGGPYILALDAATGSVLWQTTLDTSTDADVYGSPTVTPDPVTGSLLVLQGVSAVGGDPASPLRGSVSALDAATGAAVWKTYTVPDAFNGGAVWSTPAVDLTTGTVYVGTGNAYSGAAAPTTDAVLALDLHSGAIERHFQATSNDVFSSSTPGLDFDFGASPNLMTIGTRTLVGEGQKEGTYWALNRSDLSPAWHTQIGPGSVVGGILGSTAYDSSIHQVMGPISAPGYLWSLGAGTGTPTWVTAAAADPVHLSPVAVSNGVVYSLASAGFVAAWDEHTGVLLGEMPLNALGGSPTTYSASFGGVAVADGLVVADTGTQGSNGAIVAFAAG